MPSVQNQSRRKRAARPLDIPVGRVEFMGQVLHIVEHEGRLVAACNDEQGMPYEALASLRLNARACRDLMHEAVDLLIQAADISLMFAALAASGAMPCPCRGQSSCGAENKKPPSRKRPSDIPPLWLNLQRADEK